MKVVVTDFTFPALDQETAAAQAAGANFASYQCKSAEEVAAAVAGADVAVVQFASFGPAAAAAIKPGATVIRYGVGYNNIDLAACAEHGLKVGYVPDYCADEVADHTAAAALTLLRKLVPMDQSVRAGEWAAVKIAKPMKPFNKTNFGFFGLGNIGRAVHTRLKGFGFQFLAADPGLTDAQATEMDVRKVSPETLLREADIISLHAPATAETTEYFNAARLKTMQPHAMLVNSARGQLINDSDLAVAVTAGTIAAAALDVFHVEPLQPDNPLRKAPNLLLTPHAAWYSEAAIHQLQFLVAQDITRALAGQDPRKPVPR
ncbi:C-terminal binding protein [Cypionkella sp.]|uniref:C-terminal binding protein n=1 Tax=Cypionkella sp. TaxID=2811411 RepID=UPI00262CB7EF|nr:C-terminal binding protein [Cypionkella sp.]MDB5665632.1 dihydrofolate reductase [Cypionkella sp.]